MKLAFMAQGAFFLLFGAWAGLNYLQTKCELDTTRAQLTQQQAITGDLLMNLPLKQLANLEI